MKKIFITGATGGIGSQIVELLAGEDVEFFLQYFNEEKKKEKENYFKHLRSKISFFKADLTDEKQTKEMLNLILEKGGADIIIHCVSLPIQRNELAKKDWADFEKHISLQTKSFFLITKHLVPVMVQKKKGKIISILTEAVTGKPPTNIADYVTAKYALYGLSKCIASEYGKFNITCNCISPGLTETELTKDTPSKLKELVASQTPLKRISTTKDIALVVKFLCSEDSNFITGENILVDGGFLMK